VSSVEQGVNIANSSLQPFASLFKLLDRAKIK